MDAVVLPSGLVYHLSSFQTCGFSDQSLHRLRRGFKRSEATYVLSAFCGNYG
jgi:hypothetical protein